jgi:hypothetical protein
LIVSPAVFHPSKRTHFAGPRRTIAAVVDADENSM